MGRASATVCHPGTPCAIARRRVRDRRRIARPDIREQRRVYALAYYYSKPWIRRRWRAAHRERDRAANRESSLRWYYRNREAILARMRARYRAAREAATPSP